MDDRTNTFRGTFYEDRKPLLNGDLLDNSEVTPTHRSDYLLRQIAGRVSFGQNGVQPSHAGAMHRKSKLIDLYGPEALAGRHSAFQPILVNGVTNSAEPLIINVLNDRIALMQELTTSICVRSEDEVELLRGLLERGYLRPSGSDNDDEDGETVG
tara:strand:+ start:733 stop:1197 length:465 start_codon:yes stop_codon:yes gene_type:complete